MNKKAFALIAILTLGSIPAMALDETSGIPVHITANNGVPVHVVNEGLPVTAADQCSSTAIAASSLQTQLKTYTVQLQTLIAIQEIASNLKKAHE